MVSFCPLNHLWSSLFLGWIFIASCTLCQSWQKEGENVFLFKILHVMGRNTCLCKGELCFIFVRGSVFLLVVLEASFSFLYTGLMTIYLWHTLYLFLIFIYDDVCYYSPISLCVVSLLSLYTCFFMYAILYFCFTLRCLDEFCLKCLRKTGCKIYHALNSLLAKFFKSLC